MYEASFGLKRRPFAATPDASCFLTAGPIQAALDELVVCVQQGQGIAVLTAPAGTGKTLLCERLRTELDDRYETVFLRHASFLTRRALLQTVLCELNHQYHHPSEQELRLELFPAIRALQPKREALVLICDEAHQLSDSLLEELRILADFAESGRPLVRLVLVGQLSLEEKLAQPGLEAFNQRIRAHISLSTFDHAGSLDYLDYRVTWAGGRTDEVFTPPALNLIASASDGVPRCINQLADHTLLLAFVAEQQPAGEELVREALNDLRQLPLQWNEPAQSLSSSERSVHKIAEESRDLPTLQGPLHRDSSGYLSESKTAATMYSYEPENDAESSVFEVGASAQLPLAAPDESHLPTIVSHETAPSLNTADYNKIEVHGDDWRQAKELFQSPVDDDSEADAEEQPDDLHSDMSRSAFKRRIDFHNLVQETYNSASELPPAAGEDASFNRPTISTSSQLFGDLVAGVDGPFSQSFGDHDAANISASRSDVTKPADEFQEEVILDRYTAIDAGLKPPVMPAIDTTPPVEVRHQPFVVETFSSSFSSVGSFESAFDSRIDRSAEKIAAEVYSLGETLRPSDSLSAPTESILKALRDEVENVEGPVTPISNDVIESAEVESTQSPAGWDAIETPAPPPPKSAESRPFRFLFSSLRRKQQGLA